jgi:hypothetical protein
MSDENANSGNRDGNQQRVSLLSKRATMLAVTGGIAFALVVGTSYLAVIQSDNGKPINLWAAAVFAHVWASLHHRRYCRGSDSR